MNSDHLPPSKRRPKTCGGERIHRGLGFLFFREKVSNFSLRSRAIGPSDSFGPRSKAVLRSEGFAWVPVLGSFDKLREVGVLSYLKLHFV